MSVLVPYKASGPDAISGIFVYTVLNYMQISYSTSLNRLEFLLMSRICNLPATSYV